tara:strand:+ start:282 stop:587 length:306 start_codon:yes stop_codon:yes gene_type:complete
MNPVLVKPLCYVLELEDNNYYIGSTYNFNIRYAQHEQGMGAKWTRLHAPISVKEIRFDCNENQLTLEYMRLIGYKNVRGGSWCKLILNKDPTLKYLDTNKE